MKSDVHARRQSLQKRELELRRLMRQMEFDRLQLSPVYRNLEHELRQVLVQLDAAEK